MPLPLILGVGAGIAGAAGLVSGVKGGKKMKEANDTMKSAEARHNANLARFEFQSGLTTEEMDRLGKVELEILNSFERFTEVFEKIQSKPQFGDYKKGDVNIPKYSAEDLKQVSVGAGVLLGGIGGAAMGTAGGFAAAGATTAAVMALGTASTGTAIASLSGVAATNATLAAIGGGAIAAGGGGMALGASILGAATLGVGVLVGGIIFNITGSSISNKADEAERQMKKAEGEINKVCVYLNDLKSISLDFKNSLSRVQKVYKEQFKRLVGTVEYLGKTDWNLFTEEEKLITENTVLLVNLLYKMCKVQLVLASENSEEPNKVNTEDIKKTIFDADTFLKERFA